jgi:tryprostatin B 6-hydroxylase
MFSDAQAVMIAGTDTVSALLAHCFYYLAKSPGLRDQLRLELSPVVGKSCPRELAYKDLSSLPCLDSVICETLRMHSPTCNNGPRVTTEDALIDGSVIRKGVTVYVGIHSMQRSGSPVSSVFRMPC